MLTPLFCHITSAPRLTVPACLSTQIAMMLSLVTIVGCAAACSTRPDASSHAYLCADAPPPHFPGSLTSAFMPPTTVPGVQRVAVSRTADVSMVRCALCPD